MILIRRSKVYDVKDYKKLQASVKQFIRISRPCGDRYKGMKIFRTVYHSLDNDLIAEVNCIARDYDAIQIACNKASSFVPL